MNYTQFVLHETFHATSSIELELHKQKFELFTTKSVDSILQGSIEIHTSKEGSG